MYSSTHLLVIKFVSLLSNKDNILYTIHAVAGALASTILIAQNLSLEI
jgi:hypothetical protein